MLLWGRLNSGWLIVFFFDFELRDEYILFGLYYFLVIWHALRRYLGTTDREFNPFNSIPSSFQALPHPHRPDTNCSTKRGGIQRYYEATTG
jgi:hypothetical protein